jgi:cation-transporting P-type ATPase D
MLDPDGNMLCHCNIKKMNWYIQKNLGFIIQKNPPIFQLKFQPENKNDIDLGNIKSKFNVKEKENRCVVCGNKENYMRFFIIPIIYKKYLPNDLKCYKCNDVLLLCFNCHLKANENYNKKKKELIKELNIDVEIDIDKENFKLQKEILKGKKNAQIIKLNFIGKSHERKDYLLKEILLMINFLKEDKDYSIYLNDILDKSENYEIIFPGEFNDISNDIIKRLCDFNMKKINYIDKNMLRGKLVVDKIKDLFAFKKMWREYFVEVMCPKFLPDNWDLTFN